MKDYLYRSHEVTPRQFAKQVLYSSTEFAAGWRERLREGDEDVTDLQAEEIGRHLKKMIDTIRNRWGIKHCYDREMGGN